MSIIEQVDSALRRYYEELGFGAEYNDDDGTTGKFSIGIV